MTNIADTAFASLEADGRLLNAVLKGPSEKPGRFGFRGELALKFAQQFADEKRPPELTTEQVIAIAETGKPTKSFEHLQALVEVLHGKLSPDGKYFAFCNNIDLLSKYQVELGGAQFYVLPLDESTVYNELLELLNLDKTSLKRLSVAGKTDAVADAALKFEGKFDSITFAQGVEGMGPVRNRYENRPV